GLGAGARVRRTWRRTGPVSKAASPPGNRGLNAVRGPPRHHSVGPSEYDAALPGKGNAFLSPRLFVVRRFCRQLQHGCLLAFAQEGQKKSLAIRQLERIMVHMRLFTIDLAKDCRLVASGGGSAVHCDFRIEGKLRAGKHADRGAWVARSSEPARAGAEIGRSKLIANARGTRFDVHQAIVAHGIGSSVPHLLRLTRGANHGSLAGRPLCRGPNTCSRT